MTVSPQALTFSSFSYCPQNTDAALLPCISYPAFALDDEVLFNQTLDKVIRKLKGKYGFKRFLRDGYRTSLEDPNRRYYKPAEIKVSSNVSDNTIEWSKAWIQEADFLGLNSGSATYNCLAVGKLINLSMFNSLLIK